MSNDSSKSQARSFLDGWVARAAAVEDRTPELWLSERDRRLGSVIRRVEAAAGPCRFRPSNASSHFDALARSIVYQQLSKKAAATIYARYLGVLGNASEPDRVLAASIETLRSAGLSCSKARYLKELALAVSSRRLDLERISAFADEEVVNVLTQVPGIGVWTAQMFLMFRLQRLDVLPLHDAGIQRGLQLAHRLEEPAAPTYVARAGKKWEPYRSIASLYLWAALDVQKPTSTGE
ncbi:MAG: DNA-3-methyladenine glycosylase 2 family protein [Pseudomonadota bacterium]